MPDKPFTIANPYSVRLAILDTQATAGGVPEEQGNSPHGYALAHIARHLVCTGDSCAARITTRLALPITEFNAQSRALTRRDVVRGGYLGMQSDIAEAIWSEVDAWQEARMAGSREQHLVLNLSLAWDGELFGGLGEAQIAEMRAGTQAVYRALQYAAGYDALVLAAAGNQRGEPCNNFGPLLPAAWEAGNQREESCSKPPAAPLVYAVGGVGADGAPLVNARPGGMPRRAAYAENAVVACPGRRRHTAMLTGSSVATTLVSSIAADVWASFPELTSREVMGILDASGDELPMPADFWFGANASPPSDRPKVHKLSLCPALEEACARTGSAACLTQFPCGPSPHTLFTVRERSDRGSWVRDSCQPWAHPQPEVPPCLSCGPPGS